MIDPPPEPGGERAPRARATGAALIGVGLHPLALAAYEAVHLGRSPRLWRLTTAALGLLAARHLAGLSTAAGAIHPAWWTLASAALTAWWIVGAYPPSPEKKRPLIDLRGLPIAAVIGGIIFLIISLDSPR